MRLTRRRALAAATAGLGLLAGCTGGDDAGETDDETESTGSETGTTTATTASPETTTSPDTTATPTPTESPTPTSEPASDDESDPLVTMESVAFSPMRLSVEPGTTVAWENREALQHNVRAASFDDAATDWSFQSGTVGRDGRVTYRFDDSGVYQYDCGIHGSKAMCGVVVVGDASYDGTLPCE
ncbi:plastocyanin [Haloferax sp. Atlit-10N]|uniref:Amicyanin n=1 Tax=Haloferax prahovense (strain DSM 18310 / JCM 13924 / TL6) TaxID=1227461 RepID=M0GJD3_HALPT|nr:MULTISPECIES: plastocyanin/azurin family copper-binding protein [Haloferax]ELZ71632.1 Amicyanin [Haloferax prahovense DSM 18310]RDZ46934.1 plastocyanin [Haloferax sp. Atlit-16N]RDZ60766.1 plastocyanin [Haloferax sp. Atlit-10N]